MDAPNINKADPHEECERHQGIRLWERATEERFVQGFCSIQKGVNNPCELWTHAYVMRPTHLHERDQIVGTAFRRVVRRRPPSRAELSNDLRLGHSLKSGLAPEHLIHHDAVRVDVRLFDVLLGDGSEKFRDKNFRGHVRRSPDRGHVRALRDEGLALRKAEVGELHAKLATLILKEAVAGLQVAMLDFVILEVLHPLRVHPSSDNRGQKSRQHGKQGWKILVDELPERCP